MYTDVLLYITHLYIHRQALAVGIFCGPPNSSQIKPQRLLIMNVQPWLRLIELALIN